MEIGSILLILALLVLVILFISRPFFAKEKSVSDQASRLQDHEHSFLLAERDRLLNALQELDFDYDLHKVPEEDYAAQRGVLLQRGADVLRRLDALEAQSDAGKAEDRIEAAIAARRAAASPAAVAPNGRKQAVAVTAPDDALEAMLADRRRVRQEKAAGFCSQCGGPVQKSDQFCPRCGAKTV
jgi:hypothetical protein